MKTLLTSIIILTIIFRAHTQTYTVNQWKDANMFENVTTGLQYASIAMSLYELCNNEYANSFYLAIFAIGMEGYKCSVRKRSRTLYFKATPCKISLCVNINNKNKWQRKKN